MFKFFAIFVVLAVFYLFYPFRDLYVREDAFSRELTLQGSGYWTLDACKEAAAAAYAKDYLCRKRTGFATMSGTYTQYGKTKEIE